MQEAREWAVRLVGRWAVDRASPWRGWGYIRALQVLTCKVSGSTEGQREGVS